jgi:hypothetical protein
VIQLIAPVRQESIQIIQRSTSSHNGEQLLEQRSITFSGEYFEAAARYIEIDKNAIPRKTRINFNDIFLFLLMKNYLYGLFYR